MVAVGHSKLGEIPPEVRGKMLKLEENPVEALKKSYRLNLSGEAIKFSDKIVTAKNIAQVDNIYLQRSGDCEKGDSGWYIGPVNKDDDTEELEDFYAYQLLKL